MSEVLIYLSSLLELNLLTGCSSIHELVKFFDCVFVHRLNFIFRLRQVGHVVRAETLRFKKFFDFFFFDELVKLLLVDRLEESVDCGLLVGTSQSFIACTHLLFSFY